MPESVLVWGIDLILQLQASIGDWAIGPLNFFTFLGYEEWYLLMMPFVFWCVEARLGLRLAVFLALAGFLTAFLKITFHDPRPYWYDDRVRLLARGETSFGIPSGHALIGVTLWGSLAQAIRKPWAWIAAAVIVFMIGISRFILGVHFPTDVFSGWLIGALLFTLVTRFGPGVVAFYQRFSFVGQVLLVLAASVLLVIAGITTNSSVEARFEVPAAWSTTANADGHEGELEPFDETVFVTNAAILFGAVVGYSWLSNHGGFDAGGSWPKRILRYITGMAVAVGIWAGLDAAFALLADDATLLGIILRFIRYALIGIWVAALAPRAFIRLGWAKRIGE